MESIKEFPRGISDQAISKEPAPAGNQRSPGPGLKQQAASTKLQAPISLNQGTSNTQHVSKTLDRGPRPR